MLLATHTTANASKYQILNVTIVSVLNWEELDIRKQRRIGEEEKSQKWTRQDYIYCTYVGVYKKKKKRPTDRPYLKTPSARKTGVFFFVALEDLHLIHDLHHNWVPFALRFSIGCWYTKAGGRGGGLCCSHPSGCCHTLEIQPSYVMLVAFCPYICRP